MQTLQQKASEWSGVKQEDAFAIDQVNLFDKLGLQPFINLSTDFYTSRRGDPHFASSPTSKKRRRGRGRGRWFGVARVDGLGRMGDDPIPCSLRVNSSVSSVTN
uniref:Uncharacterized protein n=1 Tax=Helianthus annuus TaxID=4232 RepID=A0A251UEA3_HELAN